MKNKRFPKEEGITLIVLIVTIIILLILAGITISQLAENGLFEKSKFAKEKNEEAVAKEIIQNKIMEYIIYSTEKNQLSTLEGLKEYFDNDENIKEIVLYYQKQASITDNFQTVVNGSAVYADIKLKDYTYIYTLNQKLEIVEVSNNEIKEEINENNGIEEKLQKILDKSSVTIELADVLTSKNLMEQILKSESAIEYIVNDRECLGMILSDIDISNMFFSNEVVYNSIIDKKYNIEDSKELIPQLSSNQGENGIASCSSSYGEYWDAWIAFNNRTSGDGWYPESSPAWIQYEFNSFRAVNKFFIMNETGFDGKVPNAKLQYSYDGKNWIDATDFQEYAIDEEIYIELTDSIYAKYFRLYLTTGTRLYKFQLYGSEMNCILDFIENKNETNKMEKIMTLANINRIVLEDMLCSSSFINKLDDSDNLMTVPAMESSSQDGITITASSYYENDEKWDGWRAFDNNFTSTYTFFPITSPGWVQVEYPNEVALYKFYYSSIYINDSTNCKILSSNDGVNWISRTGDDYITVKALTYTNLKTTGFAKYWKFETTSCNQYYDLQFYGINN